jgi:VWFA-related protein
MAILLLVITTSAKRQISGDSNEVTIPVTIDAHSQQARAFADQIQPADFVVYEEKRLQPILAVRRPAETPLIVAVLLQDNLVSHVNNEIGGIKEFIRGLPDNSRVMIGYIGGMALLTSKGFTTDRDQAADSLRITISSTAATPYSPYFQVADSLRLFESQPAGRRMLLLVSDGLDISHGFPQANPIFSLSLERAISEAQRRGVAVYSFYSPSAGLTRRSRLASNYGQSALNRLSDETGGKAFFSGFDFVTFDPYFKEVKESLGRQWLITYQSTNSGTGFRRIKVTTDFDLDLHYPAGYSPSRSSR